MNPVRSFLAHVEESFGSSVAVYLVILAFAAIIMGLGWLMIGAAMRVR